MSAAQTSATSAPPPAGAPKVVAFGGGHGLAASLGALRRLTDQLTAVVTVADDGGSSGRMRRELDVLPPGDLRMALAALAGDDDVSQVWVDAAQHRFAGAGSLAGHAVGNLVLGGLIEVTGDPVLALDLLGQVMRLTGRVLPLSCTPLDIIAEVAGLDPTDPSAATTVSGQVAVAATAGRVLSVRLSPEAPAACPEALDALADADWAVIGPGSWFTSVIPHLLVPDMVKALAATRARKLLALNLTPQSGETEGFSAETHLEVLAAHAPDLIVDVVLADPTSVADDAAARAAAASLGAELHIAKVAATGHDGRHDAARLAGAYRDIFTSRTPSKGHGRWQ